jgi:hypothetical protein
MTEMPGDQLHHQHIVETAIDLVGQVWFAAGIMIGFKRANRSELLSVPMLNQVCAACGAGVSNTSTSAMWLHTRAFIILTLL